MSTKQIYLDTFDSMNSTLMQLAAQEPKQIPADASPEAVKILAAEMREDFVRFVGLTREVAAMFKSTTATIRDLQLAKDPEVELLARQIYAYQPKVIQAPTAFDLAVSFIVERDKRREAERRGLAPK